MPGPLHDGEGRIFPDGAPRDAGRAEVVERDGLAGAASTRVVVEQLGTGDAREPKAPAKLARELAVRGARGEDTADTSAFLVHCLEKWEEGRIDGHATRCLRLRGRHVACPPVDALMNVHHAVFEIDVIPGQPVRLCRAKVEVSRDGERSAPLHRDVIARHELRKLGGVQVDLHLARPNIGAANALRGVVVAHAEVTTLARARIVEQLRDERPGMNGCLPRQLSALYAVVEVGHEVFEVTASNAAHVERTDSGEHPLAEAALIGVHAYKPAQTAVWEPSCRRILSNRFTHEGGDAVHGARLPAHLRRTRARTLLVFVRDARVERDQRTLPIGNGNPSPPTPMLPLDASGGGTTAFP